MPYLGAVKPTETTSSVLRSTYTGDGSTTTFNLPGPVANETSIIATINGVTQQDAAYTTNGSQIIFSAAPSNGDAIEIRTISDVGMSYAPSAGSVTTGILADGAVTTGKINDAAVTTGKINDAAVTAAKLGVGAAVSNIGARAITAAQVPAGSVIQVVQDTFADTYSTSSTGGTPFRSLSITPSSASSKILVLASFMTRAASGGGNCYIRIQGFRNGSMFWDGYPVNGSQNTDHRGVAAINYLDSPSTTSAVTYSFNFDATYASTVYINSNTSPSFITLMEIAG